MIQQLGRKRCSFRNLVKFDELLKVYDRAIELDPHDSSAWNGKGASINYLKISDEAIKVLKKHLNLTRIIQ